jgi:threonine dehydratase
MNSLIVAMKIPTLTDIKQAAINIKSYAHDTPILTSSIINGIAGGELYFKCENFQKSGAFKFRGATNALLNLVEQNPNIRVTTHSSGNHAGALAKAAASLGINCIVVMPENAPKVKIEAAQHYGATIRFCKPTLDARETTTEQVIKETGAVLIHPYNDFFIIAGQGTAALELLKKHPDLNNIITPVGGGGLLSGSSITAKSIRNSIQVFAGEPKGADDTYKSLQAGKIIPSINPVTMADGLLTSLGELTFEAISKNVDAILTVNEENIIIAMKMIWQYMKIIVEPSGAVPLAAILQHPESFKGKKTGVILSGGNVDLENLPF